MVQEYEWPSIGNERVIGFLESGLKNNQVAQTYVFAGRADLGKFTVALAFARNLQGTAASANSDLHILEPEEDKKGISIAGVREFIKTLSLSSFLNSYQVGIIKEADKLSEEAKSALLKTLEEPREKIIVILLVEDERSLPATILSRAQILYFQPVPAAVIYDYLIKDKKTGRSLARDLANLALGRPLAAVRYLEDPEAYRQYLARAADWLSLPAITLSERLAVLDRMFSDKTWSVQATAGAQEVLAMAEGLERDLLLSCLAQQDRLQHSSLAAEIAAALTALEAARPRGAAPEILRHLKLVAQAREYLAANVNPHLVLEQVVSNY